MNAPTKEITLPFSEAIVSLRLWITNAQADYCEEPIMEAIKVNKALLEIKADEAVEQYDTRSAVHISDRRKRQVYTASIKPKGEGDVPAEAVTDPEKITEFYKTVPSVDVEFLDMEIKAIDAENKKKLPTPPTSEPTTTAG